MFIKHASEQKIKQELKEIIGDYLDLDEYDIFFFGSRVSKAHEVSDRADIDVGINGKHPVEPVKLEKIKEEVKELPVLYKIDVVDFQSTSKDFREVALENTEPIA
ncbi:MAG: nucleotidyltransferase domain-containing protein [Candidatus Paceibacteria bacterium]